MHVINIVEADKLAKAISNSDQGFFKSCSDRYSLLLTHCQERAAETLSMSEDLDSLFVVYVHGLRGSHP